MIVKYWVHALEIRRVWIYNISYIYLSFHTNFKKQMQESKGDRQLRAPFMKKRQCTSLICGTLMTDGRHQVLTKIQN